MTHDTIAVPSIQGLYETALDPMQLDLLCRARTERICLATHNAGKLAEFQELFAPIGIDFVSAGDLGLPEPVEDGTTYLENVRIKAHAAAKASGLISLADDSGIAIEALGGAPGVYTADWSFTPSGRDFSVAIARAKTELDAAGATTDEARAAVFTSMLCLAHPDGREFVVEGEMEGTFVWPPRGTAVGFNPAFQPKGSGMTYGEMHAQLGKYGYRTHRTVSFEKLAGLLQDAAQAPA